MKHDDNTFEELINQCSDQQDCEQICGLGILARTAEKLANPSPDDDIYKVIGTGLYELARDALVIVNSFDEQSGAFCLRTLIGAAGYVDCIAKALGAYNPVGLSLSINDEARKGLQLGTLEKVPDGIYNLSMGHIPRSICSTIEKMLNISEVRGIGFNYKGNLLGSASILLRNNDKSVNSTLVNAFAGFSSIALQIRQMEEAQQKNRLETEQRIKECNDELEKVSVTLKNEINEHKLTAQLVKASDDKYSILINNCNQAIIVAQDGKLKFANRRTLEITGYSEEELTSRPLISFIHSDDQEATFNFYLKRLNGELGADLNFFRVVDKQGNIRWVENKGILISWEGKPATLNFFSDITERRHVEEDLRLKAQLLDNATDAILLRDLEGNIIFANGTASRYYGYGNEELLKMTVIQLRQPEFRESFKSTQQELLKNGSSIFETVNVCKDGSLIPVEVNDRIVESEGKKLVLGVIRDISQRKRLEKEKIELENKANIASHLASVGELAASIAHEINNPLTGVIAYAEMLQKENVPEHLKNDLKIINDGAQRVSGIIKRLLSFARQTKPERNFVQINRLIQSTLDLKAYHLKMNNIEVITHFDPDLPITIADSAQLQQVFLNLVANAENEMKAFHGKGTLLIRTEKIMGDIVVSFKDDGHGISKENMEKLFSPFFTTKEIGEGSGLGLNICQGIVKAHEGTIWAESISGNGATFFVKLPIIVSLEELKIHHPEEEMIAKAEGAKILVVDDEEVIRDFLKRILIEQGYQVNTATNAEKALETIRINRYRIILIDVKMPGMDGMELYYEILKIAKSLAERIVFITGDVMGKETSDFLKRTKAKYITKPFSAEEIRKALANLLK